MVSLRFRLLLIALAWMGFVWFLVRIAEANHNVYLPLVPNTWLMQRVIQNQEQVWCADSRASAYPNFIDQLRDVNDQYTARVGIKHRQVTGDFRSDDPQVLTKVQAAGCQVFHTMPDGLQCDGWAAQIFYANSPVIVQYCYKLGYTDWRSAHGHELGHGLLGLHEQYRDSGGSIGCTGRSDTVMDCGFPHVRYPQPLDVDRGCAIILTAWCGKAPAVDSEWCCDTTYPGWAPTVSRLHVPSSTWYWGINDFRGVEQLWRWRGNGPWQCVSGCPGVVQ